MSKEYGHADNSESSEISKVVSQDDSQFNFAFPCSCHHDNLKSSGNFDNLSTTKNSLVSSYCFWHYK